MSIKVNPTKPIAAYIGGKSKLAKTIIPIINKIPHTAYAEPFVGMGGIFLRRATKPRVEIINDYNNEVANLFRIIQRHEQAFIHAIQHMVTSRQHFKQAWDINPHTLTDIDRAVRFFYVQKLGFGGRVGSTSFGISKNRPARFNPRVIRADILKLSDRLSGVVIESLDFQTLIEKYDQAGMLFYLDPPYYNCETDYGKDLFCRDDFIRLAQCLTGIKGVFILSLNDTPEIRDIFTGFKMMEVQTTYSLNKNNITPANELLISNTPLSL